MSPSQSETDDIERAKIQYSPSRVYIKTSARLRLLICFYKY